MSESLANISEQLQQLRTQNAQLNAQIAGLKSMLMPDGFAQVGKPKVVFCNVTKGNGTGWYILEGTGDQAQAVTLPPDFYGYVEWLRLFQADSRRNSWKFRLHMRTRSGQMWFFESGYNAFFAKTAIATLAQTQPEYLRHLVHIHSWVKDIQGENEGEKTLAVSFSLPAYDYRLEADWNRNTDFRQLLKIADLNIQTATGKTRQGGIDSYD
jgi:hypothetical protein